MNYQMVFAALKKFSASKGGAAGEITVFVQNVPYFFCHNFCVVLAVFQVFNKNLQEAFIKPLHIYNSIISIILKFFNNLYLGIVKKYKMC